MSLLPTTTLSFRSQTFGTRTDGRAQLQGIAAPFNSWTDVGGIRESIRTGAFTRALKDKRDILLLKNHNPSEVLGRRANRTLSLREEYDGLHFYVDLPDTTLGRDTYTEAVDGLLGGVSIGFDMRNSTKVLGNQRHTLTDIDLREISIVSAFPAYPQTVVEARTEREDWQTWLASLTDS